MITYTVKPGDMIGVIAVRYQTTIRILMDDNPFIPANQKLVPGWKLKIYTPEENAKRHTGNAYQQIEDAEKVKSTLETHEHMLTMPDETPIVYKERPLLSGQIGFAKVLKPTDLIELQANGYQKFIRTIKAGELLRVYESVTYDNGLYLVNNFNWVTNNPEYVRYEPIPIEILRGKFVLPEQKVKTLAAKQTMITGLSDESLSASAVAPETYIGIGPKPSADKYQVAPQSFIGSGASRTYGKANDGLSSIPVFERPNYKRPVLQMRNAAGESTNVELRVLGFNAQYSNSVQPANTNAGWMINIRANNLPVLNISGFLMETKAQNEFDDFMQRYHKYLEANRSGEYYAMGISTLFYKKTEYKGIVVGFSYSDREDETLHRKYSLQMMVLKEKSLSPSEISKIPSVTSRSGKSEAAFRSDLASMLINPVTGRQYTDFY
jgi:LysM domain